jgi:uncharacterized protein (TIGR04255 family)
MRITDLFTVYGIWNFEEGWGQEVLCRSVPISLVYAGLRVEDGEMETMEIQEQASSGFYGSRKVRYKNPPVVEVIFDLKFKARPFPLVHFRKIAVEFKALYPVAKDLYPVAKDHCPSGSPGIWLETDDAERVIQIQSGRFTWSWRRQGESVEYPGHGFLSGMFSRDLEAFDELLLSLGEEKLSPLESELGYLNQIPLDDPANYDDCLFATFPDIRWRKDPARTLPRPVAINWQTYFIPDQTGLVAVELKAPAFAPSGPWKGRQVIRFDLSARGVATEGTGLPEALEWFAKAHHWMLTGFLELASEEARRVWGESEEGE